MIIDGIEYFPVTDNPEKLAQLRKYWDAGIDSKKLAEFAMTLGLTPPDYEQGAVLPSIVEVWRNTDESLGLIWDIDEIEEGDIDEGRPEDLNP